MNQNNYGFQESCGSSNIVHDRQHWEKKAVDLGFDLDYIEALNTDVLVQMVCLKALQKGE